VRECCALALLNTLYMIFETAHSCKLVNIPSALAKHMQTTGPRHSDILLDGVDSDASEDVENYDLVFAVYITFSRAFIISFRESLNYYHVHGLISALCFVILRMIGTQISNKRLEPR
jgi:hypothetical protein